MAAGYDGSVRIDTSLDSKGFNAGIKGITGSLKGLAGAMGVALGIRALVEFGRAGVDTATEISNAFIGMESIVEGQGRSWAKAKQYIQDYIADGLVPVMNATTAYKNLAARGYSDDQIRTVMEALKNSAAFGRQSSLTLGQAVQSATEGLKNENSILVDNAGVTKNVSVMWKEYADSLGIGVQSLTKAQKIQAEVNGIQRETRFQMGDAAKLANTYSGEVASLGVAWMNFKAAIGNAIIPILQQIIPLVKQTLVWLTGLADTFGQVMSAIFGTQMGQVADSTQAAADAEGNLADQTEAAAKAAKNQLAAFDELNVLQKEQATPAAETAPITSIVGGQEPTAAISPEIIAQVEAFKAKLQEIGQWITDTFVPIWAWISQAATTAWNWISQAAVSTWYGIVSTWGKVSAWFETNVTGPLRKPFNDLVATIADSAKRIYDRFIGPLVAWFMEYLWPVIRTVINTIIANWKIGFDNMILNAKNLLVMITGIIGGVMDIFNGLIKFITGVFTGDWRLAWEGVKKIFSGIWQVLSSIVKGELNILITLINGFLQMFANAVNTVINGLNGLKIDIPSWVPFFGGNVWSVSLPPVTAPQIPMLATGAVIPPNASFLAMLGDQRNGRNLEAPEGLIRQIIREEIGQVKADVTINFTGSMAEFVRGLKPHIDRENVRIGGNLIRGGA